ncbi:hypothetical protein [Paracoccus mutanolyticus]|nr:hypothetical protein [Paracoccus mutanolyticus]
MAGSAMRPFATDQPYYPATLHLMALLAQATIEVIVDLSGVEAGHAIVHGKREEAGRRASRRVR